MIPIPNFESVHIYVMNRKVHDSSNRFLYIFGPNVYASLLHFDCLAQVVILYWNVTWYCAEPFVISASVESYTSLCHTYSHNIASLPCSLSILGF